MPIKEFIKKNFLFLLITILFIAWMSYLTVISLISIRTISFYNLLTPGEVEDVSNQYISQIPFLRYFIEPFVGLTFVFSFESDPRGIFPLFIMVYLIIRLSCLALDNTVLNKSGKKEVLFRYVKDVLEFFTKWVSLLVLIGAIILITGLFALGFQFVADSFQLFFHILGITSIVLLIGKSFYNLIILFRRKSSLKVTIASGKTAVTKTLIRIRRELFYFWTAFLLLFTLNFTMLSIHLPTQEITAIDLAPDEVLFDFHGHTILSDGMLTPQQRVMWYIQQGIHGAAITDHNQIRGALCAKIFVENHHLDFTVIIAEEFTDDPEDLHLNIFFDETVYAETIIPEGYTEGPYAATNRMNVSEMIAFVKNHSGYVIVNHYNPNASAPFTYEQLVLWGVDGFEVHEGEKYREILDFCVNNNNSRGEPLICLSSSDVHMTSELNEFTRLKLTDPTNRTVAHIFECLRYNNHSGIVIPAFNYPKHDLLKTFNNYLLNSDGFQALSWIIWSFIAYAGIILLLRRIKRTELAKLTPKISDISK